MIWPSFLYSGGGQRLPGKYAKGSTCSTTGGGGGVGFLGGVGTGAGVVLHNHKYKFIQAATIPNAITNSRCLRLIWLRLFCLDFSKRSLKVQLSVWSEIIISPTFLYYTMGLN